MNSNFYSTQNNIETSYSPLAQLKDPEWRTGADKS